MIDAAMAACFQPQDARKVYQWAEDEIYLSARQTETDGPFSTLMTPYVREPLEFFRDKFTTDLVLCWGTQTAKSNTMMIGVAWRLVNRPSPVLWVLPTEDLAKAFCRERWVPVVEDCKALTKKKHPNKRLFQALYQDFTDAMINWVGTNSPANASSRPSPVLVMDETDKFAMQNAREASALKLLENRTKSFTNPKRVKTSTPTTEDGEIWKEFLKTDQRYYMVPCPHCREKIRLQWKHVEGYRDKRDEAGNWDLAQVRVSAYYQCQLCNGRIEDHHKMKMLREGEWVATNLTADPSRRGYHLNSLYAPWRSCGFGALAVQWVEAQKDLGALQDFMNSAMAEPWSQIEANIKLQDVINLRDSEYVRGEIPFDATWLVAGVDVGHSATHWVICAINKDTRELAVVDWGTCLQPEEVADVLRSKSYQVKGADKIMKVNIGLIDSGDQTTRVYDVCKHSGGLLWPSKGSDAIFGSWATSPVPSHPGLTLYTYVDHTLKTEVYSSRIKQQIGPRIRLPRNADAELMNGLSGQQLVKKKGIRGVQNVWKKVADDHYGDGLKLCVLISHVAQTR